MPRQPTAAELAFGDVVRQVLDQQGRGSRKRMADALGVSSKTVNSWTRGQDVTPARVAQVATYLGVEPEEVWGSAWPEYSAGSADEDGPAKRGPASVAELRLELDVLRSEVALHRAALERAGLLEPAPAVDAIDAFGAAAQTGGEHESGAARLARGVDHWSAEARLHTPEERRRRLAAQVRVDPDDPTRKWIEGRRDPAGSGEAAADAADALGDAADVSREQRDGTAQPPERKKPSHGA